MISRASSSVRPGSELECPMKTLLLLADETFSVGYYSCLYKILLSTFLLADVAWCLSLQLSLISALFA